MNRYEYRQHLNEQANLREQSRQQAATTMNSKPTATPKLTNAQKILLGKIRAGQISRNWLSLTWRDNGGGYKAVNYQTYVKLCGMGLIEIERRGDWEYLVERKAS